MGTLLSGNEMPSSKRTARIRVEPLPADLHARLVRYAAKNRYSRLNDALWHLADIALSVMDAPTKIKKIKVNKAMRSQALA